MSRLDSAQPPACYAADTAWLDCLIEREILRLQARYELSLDELRGLYISDHHVDALLHRPQEADGDPLEQLAREADGIAELRGGPSPLASLAKCLQLAPLEAELVLLALAPELALKYETLFAYLNNDVARRYVTVDLAVRLLRTAFDETAIRAALRPLAPLFRLGVLDWIDGERRSQLAQGFMLSPVVAPFLLGLPVEDARVPAATVVHAAQSAGAALSDAARDTVAAFARRRIDACTVVVCIGDSLGEQQAAAQYCAQSREHATIMLPWSGLATDVQGWPVLQTRLLLLARLVSAWLVLYDDAGFAVREPAAVALRARQVRELAAAGVGVAVCVARESQWAQLVGEVPFAELRLPAAHAAERALTWAQALGERGVGLEPGLLAALAERFVLSRPRIQAAAHSAVQNCTAGVGADLSEALWHAARTHSDQALAQLAQPVVKPHTWKQLVLPAATLAALREVAVAVAQRERVFREWGMAQRIGRGSGLMALFAGASGTGKSMSAAVIANGLGVELYRIDLSAVVSKYIGETEKNLDRIFDAARCSNAILFFDEADALLGKRSEVKDAHDRYANIEVAYLLQRMEEHEGVVILASNLSKNLDQAFARRMHYVVEFPRPDAALRRQLWRGMFPVDTPLAADIDFDFLGDQFDTSGGEIQVVALEAAFLASAAGTPVHMHHLVQAMARHQIKQGNAASVQYGFLAMQRLRYVAHKVLYAQVVFSVRMSPATGVFDSVRTGQNAARCRGARSTAPFTPIRLPRREPFRLVHSFRKHSLTVRARAGIFVHSPLSARQAGIFCPPRSAPMRGTRERPETRARIAKMEMTTPGVTSQVEMTGAEITVRCLQEEGVEMVFGYPGGAILPIYDEFFKQDKVKHILVRHEQAAVHGADGYARATDKVGVVSVTSGPGLTNAVTGIATAYMDSVPLVIISGQVPTSAIGQDAFQEVDTVGITRPCVKHNFLVKDVKELALTMKKAFYIAKTGRPGPVLVDIPKDVQQHKTLFHYPDSVTLRSYNPVIRGHAGQIKKALQMILQSKRPMIYAGGGVVLGNASAELAQLVRTLGFPCTNTLMGLGGFPGTDPLFTGMLGMHGTYESNMAMQHCDVLVAVGARFDDRVIGNPKHFNQEQRQIIHIDIDPSSISKRVKVDVPIVGDVRDVLQELNRQLAAVRERPAAEALKAWWAQIAEWRGRECLQYDRASALIKPQHVLEKLYEVTAGNAYVTSDVGQHQMWAAQFYKFDKPRRWINSGGLGTMGVGLPYALGVQLAHPDATVACVTGEASVLMCIQELSTAKQYRLPVKVVNLNNRYMGMVRQWQQFFHGNRYSESYMDALPDFVKLAESFGHVGMRIEKPGDVEVALREAFARKDDLVFMDFITDQTENVFPMVPGGKGLSEMILV